MGRLLVTMGVPYVAFKKWPLAVLFWLFMTVKGREWIQRSRAENSASDLCESLKFNKLPGTYLPFILSQ